MRTHKEQDFRGAVKRRWVLVLCLTVLGAVIGFGADRVTTPVYEGTASLIVGDFSSGNVSNDAIQAMQSLTATYADLGQRQPVLSRAASRVGLTDGWRELDKSVTVQVPKESPQVIQITVDGSSRERVIAIARAVADGLVGYVNGMSSGNDFLSPQLSRIEQDIKAGDQSLDHLLAQQRSDGANAPSSLGREIAQTQGDLAQWQGTYVSLEQLTTSSSHAAIRPLDSASAARTPVSPNIRFDIVIGGVAGLLLALAIAYLLEARRGLLPGGRSGTTAGGRPLVAPPEATHSAIPFQVRNGRRPRTSDGPAQHPDGRNAR